METAVGVGNGLGRRTAKDLLGWLEVLVGFFFLAALVIFLL